MISYNIYNLSVDCPEWIDIYTGKLTGRERQVLARIDSIHGPGPDVAYLPRITVTDDSGGYGVPIEEVYNSIADALNGIVKAVNEYHHITEYELY